MGADLFESFVGSIIGAMVLGAAFVGLQEFSGGETNAILLPFYSIYRYYNVNNWNIFC